MKVFSPCKVCLLWHNHLDEPFDSHFCHGNSAISTSVSRGPCFLQTPRFPSWEYISNMEVLDRVLNLYNERLFSYQQTLLYPTFCSGTFQSRMLRIQVLSNFFQYPLAESYSCFRILFLSSIIDSALTLLNVCCDLAIVLVGNRAGGGKS